MPRFVKRACVAGAAMVLVGLSGQATVPVSAAEITVTSYGGIFETTIRECFVSEFEKTGGNKAKVVLGEPSQWVNQILANADKPPIDVLISNATFTHLAKDKGVLDKLSADKVPSLTSVPAPMVDMFNGYSAVMDFGIMGVTYDTRRIKTPPKTFKEFIDRTVAGDWKAGLPGRAYPGMAYYVIWGFADMYGGGLDNVDAAFDAIKRMKQSGNLVFWNSATDFLNMLQSGEFEIGMYFDGRTWAFKDEGNDWIGFVNPEPGSVMGPTTVGKVKNGSDAAWKFVDIVLSAGPQSCFAERMQYGVVNEHAKYSAKIAPRIVKWDKTRVPPYDKLGKYIPGWIERWNKEIGG